MLVRNSKRPVSPLDKYYMEQCGVFEIPIAIAETDTEVSDEIVRKISDGYALFYCEEEWSWNDFDAYVLRSVKTEFSDVRELRYSTLNKLEPIKEEFGLDACNSFPDDRYFSDDNVRRYVDKVLAKNFFDGDWYVGLMHLYGTFRFVELKQIG